MCREVSKKSRIPRRRATRMISRNVGPAEVAIEVWGHKYNIITVTKYNRITVTTTRTLVHRITVTTTRTQVHRITATTTRNYY